MINEEVRSTGNVAEKLIDVDPETPEERIGMARVYAELAKAYAMADLAEAIREATNEWAAVRTPILPRP